MSQGNSENKMKVLHKYKELIQEGDYLLSGINTGQDRN